MKSLLLKVGFFILIGLIILAVLAAVFFGGVVLWNNTQKGSKLEILKSDKTNAKKALVIYQPAVMSSETSDIAHQIAKAINDAGYEVTMDYPGKKLSNDISQYSILVFGSPVYVGQYSSALSDYIKKIGDLSNKRVVIFLTGNKSGGNDLASLEKAFKETKPYIKEKFISSDLSMAYKFGKKTTEE